MENKIGIAQKKGSVSILSTKKLARNQKELLLNAGLRVVEHDLISIVPIAFEIQELPQNIIFTSKNTVRIVLEKKPDLSTKNIFCVGDKTAAFLNQNGLQVKETANYGQDLAEKIASGYSNEDFIFFCGKKRRPELPDFLRQKKISISEVEVYDTHLVEKKIDRTFDGVLFFSPSAVRSYCAVNGLSGSIAFCIGKTTASEARNHTSDIIVATKPTIENVIVQVVKYFGKS
ncbi:uroporphyrinogen III methyltransferase [Salinimicrobium marinum]|uniref:Uroporphyrinogen III methyltransferase n=1 Tax=Salinimicrobium marinum TaxID=680283 RepID=A0A918SKG1_9FLAO|nr:uroporphyrinogen-III synthase [Salinimicrobium marinum]GHA45571.1 uroporphyrinogen III methyltransferase [Salinimicrobium marinum]